MADFKNQEKEILDFWDKNKIFQKSIDKDAPQGDYLFYDGPPFATGSPHYGHLVASIMKDVVPRYFTMRGYRVERRWGWDCHGLPIENIVEKELGYETKKQIDKLGIDKFNDKCCSKVLEYVDVWKDVIRRLGRWADMDNPYKTMDPQYMETIWWVFKEMWDRDLIYKDYRSMHICPRCETTLSQSEVTEGYKDIKDLSLTAKFELVDEPGTYILAWTTTPWTLIGNVALAVGKNIKYVKLDAGKEKYIIARELLPQHEKDLSKFPIVEEFKGKDLLGKKYKPLFDYYSSDDKLENKDNGWQIYDADFVSTEEGTGVVHIAPAFGEDDMALGKENNLPFVQHLGMDGIIKTEAGDFAGLHVKPKDEVQATDVKIIQYLAKANLLLVKEQYEHSYPHCWRCDTPLLNYATSSWFVAVTKIKDNALKHAKKINWSPAYIKGGRFGNWLEGARDWSISRQRYWASVIPIWECDKCEDRQVFGSIAELENISGQAVKDLHKHVVDKVTFSCKCGGTMKRIPDVLDCWFESGSMPYAQFHYPFEHRSEFDQKFPAKFIAEGVDQTRTWFYYLHVISTAIKDSPAFENVIVNGIVLAEDGKKMSKKLQNYPDPTDVMEQYGADALRMYLLSSPVMLSENISFVEKDLQIVYRRFTGLLQNIFNFYQMFSPDKIDAEELPKLNNDLDKWIVSKYYSLLQEVTKAIENYNLVKASRPIFDFVDSLSTWYVRRSRDRFKGNDKADKEQAVLTLGFILKQLSKVIAPFTPMTAEMIYQAFENQEESVHLETWPEFDEKMINQDVLKQMDTIKQIAERVHALRAKAGLKVRQPLATLEIKEKLDKAYLNILQDELNVENVKSVDKVNQESGWESDENTPAVSLDTNLTDDLKDKGVVREVIRFINSLRKEAGLQPGDKAIETYQTDSEYLQNIIEKSKTDIIAATSAGSLEAVTDNPQANKEVVINKIKIILGLKL
jgi:isoleucyl-tRNA synthetase